VMNNGEIIQIGTAEEIFRNPASEFVARFIGFDNIYGGTLKYHSEQQIGIFDTGHVQLKVISDSEGRHVACIRPENVIISKEAPRTSMRNVFEGKIVEIQDQGTFVKLTIDIGELLYSYITHQSLVELGIKEGSKVFISFKASAIKIL
ncbi:MAG: TOBE domain-containing protein, partial [Candidatus Helarchaeales archaeon]